MDNPDIEQGIAIVGMAARFPGARSVDDFWQNLKNGVESISFFSEQEVDAVGIPPHILADPHYVRARGVLDDVEYFDAEFFGFAPREAEIMDPQHRLFLECAWESLESAGYDTETFEGRIGIYAGESLNTYWLNNVTHRRDLIDSVGPLQAIIGNDRDHLTTIVSYKLNLRGPSITVQTACSTSLVAVHLACQSLLSGENDMALAGGVTVIVPQQSGYLYRNGEVGSPDGHCRAFDSRAQGTVGGNGVGVVVLKRLRDALADGDRIHAVIKGSAINNDGSVKVGYTAPSVAGQAEVIAEALAVANVAPESISYVETHGSGTELGDPIEIAALTQVFRASTNRKGFCAIGSVKTNVGHLDAAAGVAGLIKTVLALQHGLIPVSLHFERPNPQIDFANNPFFVSTALSEWRAGTAPRRAGVSSFGMGGTNAHVILEEALPVAAPAPSRPWQLLVLSAKTAPALDAATANLAEHLRRHPDLSLADVAFTYQVGRRAFSRRRILVCQSLADAVSALETRSPQQVWTGRDEPIERPVVFVFPGQGAQYLQMGSELYRYEPAYRKHVEICAELLRSQAGVDVSAWLYPDDAHTEAATALPDQVALAQAALFVVEYALAKLWMEWGVQPQALVGLDVGEYVAATLAGVLALEDALALVVLRAKGMHQSPDGATPGGALPESEAPSDIMLFAERLKRANLKPARIPFLSNTSGTWITSEEATDPEYWTSQLRQAATFAHGAHDLAKELDGVLLVVGPGRMPGALAGRLRDRAADESIIASMRAPDDRQSDVACLLGALGRLWLSGGCVSWAGFYGDERRHRLPLPTYPFERRRYWVEPPRRAHKADSAQPASANDAPGDAAEHAPFSLHPRPTLLNPYVAPRNDLEQEIVAIWREILGIDDIGMQDNFFDLGGHSLMATQIVARLCKVFPVEVTLEQFFESRTIELLARVIDELFIAKVADLTDEEAELLAMEELPLETIE
jgi:acyl transferase domain-containing protein